ncbi:hypothetical protein [uncultured Brevibacillus sp.]|uniref:hypothetical protein n=1 Tax=uncultured Brevibacillus sp. TaxID=169970 RepID=UPI0025956553|nr:hypothetical protein [uncultured Brevibacillus sp.]
MNKKQMEHMLKKLRWLNFEMIKAQEAGDKAEEEKLDIHSGGVFFTLESLGHDEFLETFLECECGHNFGLTGKETEDELMKQI